METKASDKVNKIFKREFQHTQKYVIKIRRNSDEMMTIN